jgi:hypothetical protein
MLDAGFQSSLYSLICVIRDFRAGAKSPCGIGDKNAIAIFLLIFQITIDRLLIIVKSCSVRFSYPAYFVHNRIFTHAISSHYSEFSISSPIQQRLDIVSLDSLPSMLFLRILTCSFSCLPKELYNLSIGLA